MPPLTHCRDIRRYFRCQRWKIFTGQFVDTTSHYWKTITRAERVEIAVLIKYREAGARPYVPRNRVNLRFSASSVAIFDAKACWDANVQSMHGICNVVSLHFILDVQISPLHAFTYISYFPLRFVRKVPAVSVVLLLYAVAQVISQNAFCRCLYHVDECIAKVMFN